MKEKECAIVVMSNDENSDLWDLFFDCLEANWKENDMEIYLISRNQTYLRTGVTTINNYKALENVMWGERLINALVKLEHEFVVFFLDDFFLSKAVDDTVIRGYIRSMSQNWDIETICFRNNPGVNTKDEMIEGLELVSKSKNYRTTTQAGIWRRKKLIEYLKATDSPRIFEWFGNVRTMRTNGRFYCFEKNNNALLYSEMIHMGKWNEEEINRVSSYVKGEVDFDKRGYYSSEQELRGSERNLKLMRQGYEAVGMSVLFGLWRNLRLKIRGF